MQRKMNICGELTTEARYKMDNDSYMGGVSNCCGAPVYQGERCSECMEGCGVVEECNVCGDYHEEESECEGVLGKMD